MRTDLLAAQCVTLRHETGRRPAPEEVPGIGRVKQCSRAIETGPSSKPSAGPKSGNPGSTGVPAGTRGRAHPKTTLGAMGSDARGHDRRHPLAFHRRILLDL